MNPEEFVSLKKDISALLESIKDVKADIYGLKLNQNNLLKKNNEVTPGISCKVAYDRDGLIIKGYPLDINDLPQITIDMIQTLRTKLDSKVEKIELDTIKLRVENLINSRPTIIPGYGVKINYNEFGLVTSSSELLEEDIPILSIDKIIGLNDRLSLLEVINQHKDSEKKEYSVIPGTFPKITYNSEGKVVSGSKLSINDIPIDLINRLNELESYMISYTSTDSFKILLAGSEKKVEANKPIEPGVYTKITVDKKGLVTAGNMLSLNDLPTINIENIPNLDVTLRRKAEQVDLVNLHNTVANLISNSNMDNVQSILRNKLDKNELFTINNRFESIQGMINRIIQSMPSDQLSNEIKKINEDISTLAGRIAVLEQKLNINGDFTNPIEE